MEKYDEKEELERELPWSFLLLLIAIMLLTLMFASTSYAFVVMKTETGEELKWGAMPIYFWVDEMGTDDVSEDMEMTAVEKAFQTWETVNDAEIDFEYMGTSTKKAGELNRINLISWVQEGWEEEEELIAFTKVWHDPNTGEIYGFDIELNGEDHDWSIADSPDPMKTDLENTLAHEIGHVLGLGHPMEIPEATMYPTAAKGEIDKRDLFHDDEDGARFLYQLSGDEEGGCGGMSVAGTGGAGNVPRISIILLVLPFFIPKRALKD